MRALPSIVGFLLAVSVLLVPASADAAAGPSIYWGAYIKGAPFDTALIDAFESHAGKHMSIITWGAPWILGGHFEGFQTAYFQSVRDRGAIPMLTWGTWDLGKGTSQPNFQLADISAGKYDGFVTQWAQGAKAWGKPFFLRMDHEMNGWWYPWSEQLNGNRPGDFVRAWRHVHDIFTRVGASNVTWVWCPNIVSPKSTSTASLYPGSSYVDWTCMDGYNWGSDRNNSWQTFAQIVSGSALYGGHNTYQELLSVAPDKPIMLGETASSEHAGNKSAWITDMLTNELPTRFPKIKAFIWSEFIDHPGTTWPIESSGAAQAAFARGISSSTYASNQFSSTTGRIKGLQSSTPPVPVSPSGTSVSLAPVADTYTSRSAPTSTAGGSSTVLRADLVNTDTAYLRFDLSGLAGKTLTSATLRVHSASQGWSGSKATFDVKLVSSTTWQEASMSFANLAPVSGTVAGSLTPPTSPNTWYSITLSPGALQPSVGKPVSVAITGRSGDVFIFDSREAGSSNAPRLELTFK